MKKILIFVTLILFLAPAGFVTAKTGAKPTAPTTKGIRWTGYTEGFEKAAAEGKKIFLNFHADWCYYCKVMEKKTFRDSKVISYLNDHFVAIRIDSDREKKLAMKYRVTGLPTNCFLDSDGKQIGQRPGYLNPEQLLQSLQFVHEEKYKKGRQ